MNNMVFGKIMENVRNHVNVQLTSERISNSETKNILDVFNLISTLCNIKLN